MLTEFRYDDLIGKPFRYGGRGPEDYDCWGIVKELYWRWHGVVLPDYESSADRARNAALMSAESGKYWTRLERPAPGAVLVMSVRAVGCHVGFAVTPTRFVHAMEGGVEQVVCERIGRRLRVMGAYLYAGQ